MNFKHKNDLEGQYRNLERQLQKYPNDIDVQKQLDLTKHKLNLIENEEVARKLKTARQKYFEQANKPGRWLAYKLRKDRERKWIKHLENEKGEQHYKEESKREIAWKFYKELYKQDKIDDRKICQYLERADLPKISETFKEILDKEITISEVVESIKNQKNLKAPGPDGLPAEVYKTFEETFGMLMVDLFNEVMLDSKIPDSWTEAYITLLPKEETDSLKIKNYRPISLLNVDYKLFASIMANRLKIYLSEFIHKDQNGFLPNRQLKDNVRTILNTLEYYEQHPEKQMVLMFLDAQKAFDNLNWQFLKRQIQYMNFGTKFIHVIEAIYERQSAKIVMNGELTQKIEITKGTRQGCPLSPLLFILTLEVLNRTIREDQQIKGLRLRDQEYKLQAFADDLVFILEKPESSGVRLLYQIQKFGEVAGLKINKDKTKLMVKNMTSEQRLNLQLNLNMQIANKVKYLGICLSAKTITLKEDNYVKLRKQIERDLDRWKSLQLSLMGRIALIKMNILPRLLFLFSSIPIKLEKSFFLEMNKITSRFVWQGKKPRINLKNLQDLREKGGFGLPNWEIYYQAAALTWVREWITLRNKRLLILEGHDLQIGWHAFLWYGKAKIHSYFQRHIIRSSLLCVWEKMKAKQYMKVPVWISTIEVFTHPSRFNWAKVLTYKEMITKTGNFKTMEELIKQGIKIDWFMYGQIKTRYERDGKIEGISLQKTELDQIFLGPDLNLIKKFYRLILSIELEFEQVKNSMISWMRNFGYSIDLEAWAQIWERNYKMTLATSFKENLYKMFYRWHFSPERLSKMSKHASLKCWKCNEIPGSYYHMWWTCREAKKFWIQIHQWIQAILKKNIELKPEIFLLGMIPVTFYREEIYLIVHIVTAARITYAQKWKTNIPTNRECLKKIMECAEMCRLTLRMKDKEDSEYYRIWGKFYQWIES